MFIDVEHLQCSHLGTNLTESTCAEVAGMSFVVVIAQIASDVSQVEGILKDLEEQ